MLFRSIIEQAAPKDWKAAAWLGERRHGLVIPQRLDSATAAIAGGIVGLHKSLVDKVAASKRVDPVDVTATVAA